MTTQVCHVLDPHSQPLGSTGNLFLKKEKKGKRLHLQCFWSRQHTKFLFKLLELCFQFFNKSLFVIGLPEQMQNLYVNPLIYWHCQYGRCHRCRMSLWASKLNQLIVVALYHCHKTQKAFWLSGDSTGEVPTYFTITVLTEANNLQPKGFKASLNCIYMSYFQRNQIFRFNKRGVCIQYCGSETHPWILRISCKVTVIIASKVGKTSPHDSSISNSCFTTDSWTITVKNVEQKMEQTSTQWLSSSKSPLCLYGVVKYFSHINKPNSNKT